MVSSGGGMLLGVGEVSRCSTALFSHNLHDFFPSTSHSCVSRARHRCSLNPPASQKLARCTLVHSVSVKWRDLQSVSDLILEDRAEDVGTSESRVLHDADNEPAVPQEISDGNFNVTADDTSDGKRSGDVENSVKVVEEKEQPDGLKISRNSSQIEAGQMVEGITARSEDERLSSKLGNSNGNEVLPGVHQKKKRVETSKRDSSGPTSGLKLIDKLDELAVSVDCLPPGGDFEVALASSGLKLTPRDMTRVLNALKNSDRSIEFFEWMRRNGKTRSNVYAYNIIYKVLGQKQNWSRIDNLLEEMAADDCEADYYTYNTLIHWAGKARYSEYAIKCFHAMLKKGISPNNVTYDMLITLYQRFGKVLEAESVYQHMQAAGVESCGAYSAMITLYTRGGMYEKAEQVMEDMRSKHVVPDRDNWLKQLNAYGQQGKIAEAEKVMEVMQDAGISLGIVGYNSMITAYGKAGLYESAAGLFAKLQEAEIQPDEVTYSCMIGACGRSGKLKDALRFFDEMKMRDIRPTPSNYNTLINLYGKARNVVGVLRVVSDMKKLECRPDSQALEAAVKAYERAGKTKKVTQVLGLLREAGWSPDVTSYGTLLHVYLKCNLQQEALQTFYALRKAEIAPKEYMCRSLICSCKDAGMYEDAVKVFTEMQAAGVTPSMESLCTMINVFGLKGAVAEAESLFNEIRSSRQKPDKVAHNVMINVYMRADMHQEAARIFKTMEEREELLPDSYTFHSMLRLYQKCNLPQQAVEVYWKMRNAGIKLDEVMCNCVINCCGRALPLDETSRVFQDMVDGGFAANTITFNVMIDLYGKAGMLDRARNALKLAQSQGAADKISYSTLIDAYGKRQDFPKMEATLWEMQNAGFGGSLEAFNSMLDSYGKASLLDKLEDVLERMAKAGFSCDLSTYNILINIYGRKGLLEKMERAFAKMQEEGLKPDRWTYNTLIRTYGYADLPDQAVKMLKEMQESGVMPDRVTYINLVAAFEKNGNLLEAARWSLWMTQAGYSK